ncbi:MAG: hypothetical protein J07HX64_00743 [halophilic archaeon J07HX64]|jgi:hypothetical protein|nr:MAG: hypothetical protein J07HX64_00743 [halophilic archaeon J07HX64]
MSVSDGVLSQFKQPEYTGENRCMPCTVANTLMAVGASGTVAVGGAVVAAPLVGAAAGGAVFVVSMLAIYLRGYLVPGTPELTKRYFPPWLLRLFGKEPVLEQHQPVETDDGFDPETTLVRVGALEECTDGDDLCLTDSFGDSWQTELEALDSDTGRDELLELLDVDTGEVEYSEFGRAFVARLDGQTVGKWESEAAFLADLAAARVFEQHFSGWADLSVEARGQLLNGLRLFLDVCPDCGGAPTFDSETVESCCSTYDVAAVTCGDCESRLFEARVDA